MATLDFDTATIDEIIEELNKYPIERRLLEYKLTESAILSKGQENFNGDKKHYEAALKDIREGIADCEKQLATKKLVGKCPIKGYNVNFY